MSHGEVLWKYSPPTLFPPWFSLKFSGFGISTLFLNGELEILDEWSHVR